MTARGRRAATGIIGRGRCRPGDHPEIRVAGGYSLLEVVLVTALIGVLTLLIVQSLADLARAQAFSRGQARVAEIGDRVMRGLVRDVMFSARVFTDGTEATEYLAKLDYPAGLMFPDARLPRSTGKSYFEADPVGELETGNVLFVARFREPAIVDVMSGGGTKEVRIDTTNFVIYCTKPGVGTEIDLTRWGSQPVVRHADVMSITDPVERSVGLAQLYALGFRYAWEMEESAADGLYEIRMKSGAGEMISLAASKKIGGDVPQIQESILAGRRIRVAPNGRVGGLVVPQFAAAISTGFPGGFEVKVDGPSTGKLILLRMVLRARSGSGHDNFAELRRVISCRDG